MITKFMSMKKEWLQWQFTLMISGVLLSAGVLEFMAVQYVSGVPQGWSWASFILGLALSVAGVYLFSSVVMRVWKRL